MKNSVIKIFLLLGLLCCASSLFAGSGIDNANLFDNILNRFEKTSSTWDRKISEYASWLFWTLALLSMIWTFCLLALRRAEIMEFFAELMTFFIGTGFFYWLLINGPAISKAIISSFRQIAATASGLNQAISPSSIVDVGFDIVSKVVDNSSIWSPAATTVGLIVAGIILICLALVGVNMLMILIDAWIMIYGGIILLGFGGGRWTKDIAINYYKTILGIAVQAFAMVLIVGIGRSFIDQYYNAMSTEISIKELFIMLVVSIILLTLIKSIPSKLSGIISGGGFNGGPGIGVGSAMAAGGMAAAAMSGGTALAASGLANTAGAGSALNAAFKAAAQHSSSGGDAAGLTSGRSKSGGLLSAFSSNLASGVSDVMRQKIDGAKEAIASRIAQTPGGQVADAINQKNQDGTEQENTNSSSAESFSPEGSLSAGKDGLSTPNTQHNEASPDTHDEVSQFVNKHQNTGG